MEPIKGILFCGDIALDTTNDFTATKELSNGGEYWTGLIGITVLAKEGALKVTMGEGEQEAIVDSFTGYAAVIHAGAIRTITLQSETDAIARLLLEIL